MLFLPKNGPKSFLAMLMNFTVFQSIYHPETINIAPFRHNLWRHRGKFWDFFCHFWPKIVSGNLNEFYSFQPIYRPKNILYTKLLFCQNMKKKTKIMRFLSFLAKNGPKYGFWWFKLILLYSNEFIVPKYI